MTGPTETVERELERMLENDDSRVGDVYRHRDKSAEEIARILGVRTAGFVANNRTIIRAVLEGVLPAGQVIRGQVASKVRTFRERANLSDAARAYLMHLEERLANGTRHLPRRSAEEHPRSGGKSKGVLTLRVQVEDELRGRVKDLVERIRLEAGIEAIDYWAVVTSDSPVDVVVRLIRSRAEDGTFKQLADAGRLDLSLDSAVIEWTDDLPLQQDMVEEATARRDWFSS